MCYFRWFSSVFVNLCGERGIRTPGGLHLNGFQDRRNRPLCHFSAAKIQPFSFFPKAFLKKTIAFFIESFAIFLYPTPFGLKILDSIVWAYYF